MTEIKTSTTWEPEEWDAFKKKLFALSREELRTLARKTGLEFDASYDRFEKADFVLALDESNKEDLINEYQKLRADSDR